MNTPLLPRPGYEFQPGLNCHGQVPTSEELSRCADSFAIDALNLTSENSLPWERYTIDENVECEILFVANSRIKIVRTKRAEKGLSANKIMDAMQRLNYTTLNWPFAKSIRSLLIGTLRDECAPGAEARLVRLGGRSAISTVPESDQRRQHNSDHESVKRPLLLRKNRPDTPSDASAGEAKIERPRWVQVTRADQRIPGLWTPRRITSLDFLLENEFMLVMRSVEGYPPEQVLPSGSCFPFCRPRKMEIPFFYALRVMPKQDDACEILQVRWYDEDSLLPADNINHIHAMAAMKNAFRFRDVLHAVRSMPDEEVGSKSSGYLSNPLIPKWERDPNKVLPGANGTGAAE